MDDGKFWVAIWAIFGTVACVFAVCICTWAIRNANHDVETMRMKACVEVGNSWSGSNGGLCIR